VLQVMLGETGSKRYGLEIGREAGLRSGTVHPILARLERVGWAESRWEEIDPRAEGRPARRYYWLTAEGASEARRALAKASALRPSGAPAIEGVW
jgi:DNA-binding PadR family transcriptional regulator